MFGALHTLDWRQATVLLITKLYSFTGCKIVDWQLCAGAHPLADIAASMLYNCDPQVIEDGFEQMLEAYYKVFQE